MKFNVQQQQGPNGQVGNGFSFIVVQSDLLALTGALKACVTSSSSFQNKVEAVAKSVRSVGYVSLRKLSQSRPAQLGTNLGAIAKFRIHIRTKLEIQSAKRVRTARQGRNVTVLTEVLGGAGGC